MMSQRRLRFISVVLAVILLTVCGSFAKAQTIPEPESAKLLNGLAVLYSLRPGDPNVLVKLRIRSGAAFDLAGKGGTMALLGDALFPDPTTRDYVAEQLSGKLDVTTSYDSIDITISGKAGELERIVELLRGALITTQLSTENVAKARDARVRLLTEKPPTAADIANQAIAVRLFGSFPYAHPATGTAETLKKVDRADLLLARERFLNPDNATVVVLGGVERPRVMRTLRQLLGPWVKSDRSVPLTFRQPDPASSRVLIVNQADANSVEVRVAVRGLARSDADAVTAAVLAQIGRDRWESALPNTQIFGRHEAHALPGMFVMGATVPAASAAEAVSSAQQVMRSLLQAPPTAAEFERARGEVLLATPPRVSDADSIAEAWLDREAFRDSARIQPSALQNVSLSILQRVATRLFKDAPIATVVVGNYDQLKSSFGASAELRGEKLDTRTTNDPVSPVKKPD